MKSSLGRRDKEIAFPANQDREYGDDLYQPESNMPTGLMMSSSYEMVVRTARLVIAGLFYYLYCNEKT